MLHNTIGFNLIFLKIETYLLKTSSGLKLQHKIKHFRKENFAHLRNTIIKTSKIENSHHVFKIVTAFPGKHNNESNYGE